MEAKNEKWLKRENKVIVEIEMLTLIDVFSGAGGTSLGFKNQGFEIVGALDVDKDAAETYEKNFGIEPYKTDAFKVSGKELLKDTGLSKKELTVLAGCPPCQGFTKIRPHCIKDPRNELIKAYAGMVEDILPEFVVFENVPGILSQKNEKYFEIVKKTLRKLGYAVVYDVLNAVNYGVPQFRKRVILIAAREKLHHNNLRLPIETHTNPAVVKSKDLRPWVTVREALKGLHPLRPGQKSREIPNHVAPIHERRILDLISKIPKNGGSRMNLPREMWLACHINHDGHTDVYGRMRLDKPAPCITCGFMSPSKGRYIHPTQNRTLTAREGARLQSFPDSFTFHGTFFSWRTQIGNAMPPLLVEAIAKRIRAIKSEE